ncbi:hypothetical protein ACW9I8_13380 [Pseudomonas reactans]
MVFAQGNDVAWDPAATFNAEHHIAVTGVEPWTRQQLKAPTTTH